MSANQQAEAHAADVARACEALLAATHGDRHAYVDTATGAAYLVDDEALAAYGRMLADDVPGAYLRWCETTDATEIDALYIIHLLERSHDLDALRAEADADAEFDLVVAIDLLRPTLEALLREESDDTEAVPGEGPGMWVQGEWHPGDFAASCLSDDDANDEVPAQGSDVVNTRGLF